MLIPKRSKCVALCWVKNSNMFRAQAQRQRENKSTCPQNNTWWLTGSDDVPLLLIFDVMNYSMSWPGPLRLSCTNTVIPLLTKVFICNFVFPDLDLVKYWNKFTSPHRSIRSSQSLSAPSALIFLFPQTLSQRKMGSQWNQIFKLWKELFQVLAVLIWNIATERVVETPMLCCTENHTLENSLFQRIEYQLFLHITHCVHTLQGTMRFLRMKRSRVEKASQGRSVQPSNTNTRRLRETRQVSHTLPGFPHMCLIFTAH